MRRALCCLCLFVASSTFADAGKAPPKKVPLGPVVVITTSMGTITAELDVIHAPLTVANFLAYVDDKFYDGTIWNRVIPDFMIQGGGYTAELKPKSGMRAPLKFEGAKERKNLAGSLAMARQDDLDSATSHFFINARDNEALDWKDAQNQGYCVFGKVLSGMDVVHKIEHTPTSKQKGLDDVPVTPVVIQSIRRQ